jgi:hypothetical protein
MLLTKILATTSSFVIIAFGGCTIIPNITLADSGTPRATRCSITGLIASGIYMSTGLFGIYVSLFAPTLFIQYVPLGFVVGSIVQLIAFIM